MKIAIGTDHAGIEHKKAIKDLAASMKIEVLDMGTDESGRVDYPEYGKIVALTVSKKKADLGILLCGTGIGMSMTANKVKGIRAALCWNEETARLAREHNDANILCMGARFVSIEESVNIARVFLTRTFSNEERHKRRIAKITATEERSSSCDCR